MPTNQQAFERAKQKIDQARRDGDTELDLSCRYDAKDSEKLTELPESLGNLIDLAQLWIGVGTSGNPIDAVPEFVRLLTQLTILDVSCSRVSSLPDWISELRKLQRIFLNPSEVADLPSSLAELDDLVALDLEGSPLNPELDAVKAYLRAKSEDQIVLNEAKLILIGEGEVGKTSLLGALRGDKWVENRPTTHGVEVDIKSLILDVPEGTTERQDASRRSDVDVVPEEPAASASAHEIDDCPFRNTFSDSL